MGDRFSRPRVGVDAGRALNRDCFKLHRRSDSKEVMDRNRGESTMPISVLGFYAALALWGVLIVRALSRPRQWSLVAAIGLVLLLFLNVRYLIEGAPAGIAFFVSLYDVFDNVGLAIGETPAARAACAGNACSLWGEWRLLAISCAAGRNGTVITGVGDGLSSDFNLGIGPPRAPYCGGLAPQVGKPVIEGKRSQRFTVNPCD